MKIKRLAAALSTLAIVVGLLTVSISSAAASAPAHRNWVRICIHHPYDHRRCRAFWRAILREYASTKPATPPTGMAPPAGYSASQLTFDDRFAGTSLDTANWNTAMGGQGDPTWNAQGLPLHDSAAGTHLHETYFSPSQVTVDNGLTLTMVPDATHSPLGYAYRSGVVTSYGKFTLSRGYVQVRAKMSDASGGGWPAIWFIDPNGGGGDQEIDLQEGGFTPDDAGLPNGTPENNVLVTTYHTPSGNQSVFGYATPAPMNAGYNTFGMEYIPGQSIKTYFNGKLVGWWNKDISTTPYETVIWNSQAASNTSGYHTVGASPDPSEMSIAEVQVYTPGA
jgi:beta-glucanase (GH16 family)